MARCARRSSADWASDVSRRLYPGSAMILVGSAQAQKGALPANWDGSLPGNSLSSERAFPCAEKTFEKFDMRACRCFERKIRTEATFAQRFPACGVFHDS